MIVTNDRQKKSFTDQLVRDQIKLEKQFQPKVRSLLKDIGDDAASVYVSTRSIVPTRNYIPEMKSLLRAHYKKVIPKFGFFIRNQLNVKSFVFDETKQIGDDFALQSAIYTTNHSEEQAKIIMSNHEAQIERDVNKALIALLLLMGVSDSQIAPVLSLAPRDRRSILQNMVDSNATFSEERKNRELRRLIKRETNKSSVSRAKTISITETNNPINFAMETEAELAKEDAAAIAAAALLGISLVNTKKEWVAVLDNRTRPTHVQADGQQVNVNETFIVGGYRMRFPTDTSLGAPPQEIINCRCKSILVSD